MTKLLFVALVSSVVSLTVLGSRTAEACRCAPPPAPKTALEAAAAVFAGKVVAIEEKQNRKEVKFQVSKVWKGITSNTVIVTTAIHTATCGFPFETNKEYLVYASATEGQEYLRTNICTRTKGLAGAKEDLAELGEGSTPPREN